MRFLITLLWVLLLPVMSLAAPQSYKVDMGASDLGFVYFFGDNPTRGRFPTFSADIKVDFESVSRSSIAVTLDATQASAGLNLATEAMLGETVLDAARFPQITFQSTDIKLGPHPTVIVTGDLTVRDVTRPVSFTAKLLVDDAAQFTLKERLFVSLEAEFSRSDFGASGFPDLVGDRMRLEAEIAVVKGQ